jgi:hypothetical protein
MNRYLRYAVAAAFAAGSLATSVAHAVIEMEGNDSISSPEALQVINGTAEVTGSIGNTSLSLPAVADVDFYWFEATEGDVVQIDINGGMKDFASGWRAVDTVIAVFASDLSFTLLRQNDDADDVDFGSMSTSDSRIVDFVVPATGRYIVGVSSFPRTFNDMGGGGLTSTSVDPNVGNGSYTLTVTGVTTPPVLSSSTFDAMRVDRKSLTFGADGDELSLVGCYHEGIDVNRDRRKDLVCRFELKKAGFDVGDIEGVLKGTAEGSQFEGRGPVKVVTKGKKRKHHQHHRGHGG